MVIFEIGLFDDLMIFVRQLVIVFLRKLMIRSIMVIIVVILIEFMMWQQSRNSGIVKVVIRIRMQLSGRFFLVLRIVFLVCFFFCSFKICFDVFGYWFFEFDEVLQVVDDYCIDIYVVDFGILYCLGKVEGIYVG